MRRAFPPHEGEGEDGGTFEAMTSIVAPYDTMHNTGYISDSLSTLLSSCSSRTKAMSNYFYIPVGCV
jgi:hypothetical protein